MKPHIGLRFVHKTWTDTAGKPLVYVVTAVRDGVVYIKSEDAKKAKEWVAQDRWLRVYGAPA